MPYREPSKWILITSFVFLSTLNCEGQTDSQDLEQQIIGFLEINCIQCHGNKEPESDLNLVSLIKQKALLKNREIIQQINLSVESGLMPPTDSGIILDSQERNSFLKDMGTRYEHLESSEDVFQIRRLNRNEYTKTITHLFALKQAWCSFPENILLFNQYFEPSQGKLGKHLTVISYESYSNRLKSIGKASQPPNDYPVNHGFTNEQTGLSTSPLLLETYLQIAKDLVSSQYLLRASGLRTLLIFDENEKFDSKAQHGIQELKKFLPRAFRRPVTTTEFRIYTDLFRAELKLTGSYKKAMETTLITVLISPKFLFRDDLSMSSADFRASPQFSLASRLSYFLWGSMPDDKLFQAASNGTLGQESELLRQVNRMMRDPRIKNLSEDFATQWLKLDSVRSSQPDPLKYPDFYKTSGYSKLSTSMAIEQLLLFEAIMVENRSILELIIPEFSYRNADLMMHYGSNMKKNLGYRLTKTNFSEFFRIPLPENAPGGILTSSAMLLATSTPTRTSPVSRGAWLMEVLFNRPPPSPPQAIPEFEESKTRSSDNIRERLALHRDDRTCAVCHDLIDPYGLVFEGFGVTGKHRSSYEDGSLISTTQVIQNTTVDNPLDFRKKIVTEKTRFVRGFVEHLLKYSLGRNLLPTDRAEIDRITKAVINEDCRFHSVIEQIVLSKLFLHGTQFPDKRVSFNANR